MPFDVSTSPYGPQDEIGRLNEMTPASRQRVLARVDGGTVFDLSTEYFLSILKFFQIDIAGMLRMTSSARYFKEGVGSRRPN
jgi:hypothetical protein